MPADSLKLPIALWAWLTGRTTRAMLHLLTCALAGALWLHGGGLRAQTADETTYYADEERDWGVPPTNRLRQEPYHAPTPLQIPGAMLVHTRALRAMLNGPTPPILIDVLSGEGHVTLAGAVWLAGAGRGETFIDRLQSELVPLLAQLTAGDKGRPMAFFCANSECWLSYNAALRAVAAGYTRVLWYRGGIDAWATANLPTAKTIAGRKP